MQKRNTVTDIENKSEMETKRRQAMERERIEETERA